MSPAAVVLLKAVLSDQPKRFLTDSPLLIHSILGFGAQAVLEAGEKRKFFGAAVAVESA